MKYEDHHVHLKGLLFWELLKKHFENHDYPLEVEDKIRNISSNPLAISEGVTFADFQRKFAYSSLIVPGYKERVELLAHGLRKYSLECHKLNLNLSAYSQKPGESVGELVDLLGAALDTVSDVIDVTVTLSIDRFSASDGDKLRKFVKQVEKTSRFDALGIVGDESHPIPAPEFDYYLDFVRSTGRLGRFHLGETPYSDRTMDEIVKYLGSGVAKTIAHACCLYDTPILNDQQLYLFEKLREENIPIEICPTSNRLLRGVSITHFKRILSMNVPYLLGSDDPAILGTSIGKEHLFWNNEILQD